MFPLRKIEIKSVFNDITDVHADTIALKFAQNFYGADSAVVRKLLGEGQSIGDFSPAIGNFSLVSTADKIGAKKVLLVGVQDLSSFRYNQIYEFSKTVLKILEHNDPEVRTIAMTIHGVGYGLDETESIISQVRGLLDSLKDGQFPQKLERILIVDKNRARAQRIQGILNDYLSSYCNVDKILIPVSRSNKLEREPVPETEKAGLESEKKPHIFVAMPFREDMDDIYYYGIQPSVHSMGYLCERVDLVSFTGDILDRIKSRIETAELMIADLTGSNPNVYLEVGYAWGKGLPTILIAKDGEELKFDVRGQKNIKYKRILDLEKILKQELENLLGKEQEYRKGIT
jgi:hypothetical protein